MTIAIDSTQTRTRFINLLREQFNSGVDYKGRRLKWDTVIEQKATELGHFLAGSSREVDFVQPWRDVDRSDTSQLRNRILSLTAQEAKKLGVGKSTLHYLRRNARDPRLFRVYNKVEKRLSSKGKL